MSMKMVARANMEATWSTYSPRMERVHQCIRVYLQSPMTQSSSKKTSDLVAVKVAHVILNANRSWALTCHIEQLRWLRSSYLQIPIEKNDSDKKLTKNHRWCHSQHELLTRCKLRVTGLAHSEARLSEPIKKNLIAELTVQGISSLLLLNCNHAIFFWTGIIFGTSRRA